MLCVACCLGSLLFVVGCDVDARRCCSCLLFGEVCELFVVFVCVFVRSVYCSLIVVGCVGYLWLLFEVCLCRLLLF